MCCLGSDDWRSRVYTAGPTNVPSPPGELVFRKAVPLAKTEIDWHAGMYAQTVAASRGEEKAQAPGTRPALHGGS